MSDYVVIDRIEEVHYIGLQMLRAFDRICREEGFSYSLAGGTLLGAIRHQGFIPWDDDIDVFMLREDYERFLELHADKPFGNKHYHIIHWKHGAPGCHIIRIIDDRTRVVSKYSTTFNRLWLDICPLDTIPERLEDRGAWLSNLWKKRRLRIMLNAPPFTGRTLIRKLIKTPIGFFGRLLGFPKRIIRDLDAESQKFSSSSSDLSAEVVSQAKIKGIVRKSTFSQSVDVSFEGYVFKAMPDYVEYLTGQYGHFLKLPPAQRRKAHAVKAKIKLSQYTKEEQDELIRLIYREDLVEENKVLLEEFSLTQDEEEQA